MKKIEFSSGFWVRSALRAIVAFWFYKVGRIEALSPQLYGEYDFFFWMGIVMAVAIFFVIEVWMGLIERGGFDEE